MRHFFDPHINDTNESYTLSAEESKHMIRVLRMNAGDLLSIINGKGQLFNCSVRVPDPKGCVVHIDSVEHAEPEPYLIHVALAPTKQLERIEWFIEKATEIGIHKITFLSTAHSERIKTKTDRFEKKAISAIKQSKRLYIPEITESAIQFDDFVKSNPHGLIAHCYETPKDRFESCFRPNECPIIIGPEGDFSHAEVELAKKNGYKAISLGKTRLRTETAALYATALAKHLCE